MGDYLQLARILIRKGAVVEATRTYEKLLKLHPEETVCREEFIQFLFEQGQVNRGVEESREMVRQLEAKEDYKEAGRVVDRALNYAPDEMDLRQQLAAIYLHTNRRGLALESYRSLARHYEQAGDEERLMEVFEQIVVIDPMNVECRQRLVEMALRSGSPELACSHAIQLAQQYEERELFDLAENEYRRVLTIQPENTELWERLVQTHIKIGTLSEIVPDLMMLADLYSRKGELKEAIEVLRRILECEPDNAEILQSYIDTYMQIGLEQDLVDEYLQLADVKARDGDVADSIRIYKHLVNVAPDNPTARERLTQTQQMLKNPGGAQPSAAAPSAAPKPKTPPTTDDGRGETDKLIRNYENVLKLNPSNPTARAKLADLLERDGRAGEADPHWKRAAREFFEKGDLERCIEISETLLKRHPDDTDIRDRLSKAKVQRDSLRMIDGALAD